jgi:hypothetical protein
MPDYLMLSDLVGRAEMLELRCGRCEQNIVRSLIIGRNGS